MGSNGVMYTYTKQEDHETSLTDDNIIAMYGCFDGDDNFTVNRDFQLGSE